MAKINKSFVFSEISGRLNGSTFCRHKSGQYVRNYSGKYLNKASRNNLYKAYMLQVTQAWRNLSETQVSQWNNSKVNSLSGINLFRKLNVNRLYCNLSILLNCPANVSFPLYHSYSFLVSKFYNCILFSSLYSLNDAYSIKLKASPQYRSQDFISAPIFTQLGIFDLHTSFNFDIFEYYYSAYPKPLIVSRFIYFSLSFIHKASGIESTPYIFTSPVNDFFDIVYGSAKSSCNLHLTSNNFSNISVLYSFPGQTYCYVVAKFNDLTFFATSSPAGYLFLTNDKGNSFLSYRPLPAGQSFAFPFLTKNGFALLSVVPAGKCIFSHNFGSSFAEIIFPIAVSKTVYFLALSENNFLLTSGYTSSNVYIFTSDKFFNNLIQSSCPVSFVTSYQPVMLSDSIIVLPVVTSSGQCLLLRSLDKGLSFSQVAVLYNVASSMNLVVCDNDNLFCYVQGNRHFWTSSDKGITWYDNGASFLTGSFRFTSVFNNGNIALSKAGTAAILLSQDKGKTFSAVWSDALQTEANLILKLSGSCAICFTTTSDNVLITYDSGLSWSLLSTIPGTGFIGYAFLANQ